MSFTIVQSRRTGWLLFFSHYCSCFYPSQSEDPDYSLFLTTSTSVPFIQQCFVVDSLFLDDETMTYSSTRTLAAVVNNVATANVFAACEGHIRCCPSEIVTVSIALASVKLSQNRGASDLQINLSTYLACRCSQ